MPNTITHGILRLRFAAKYERRCRLTTKQVTALWKATARGGRGRNVKHAELFDRADLCVQLMYAEQYGKGTT